MTPETTPPAPPATPPTKVPTPTKKQHTLDPPVPEEILDEWRWIFKGRNEGWFVPYAGKHIAVLNQKVVASDRSLDRLHQVLTEELHLDLKRVVTAYIDRW